LRVGEWEVPAGDRNLSSDGSLVSFLAPAGVGQNLPVVLTRIDGLSTDVGFGVPTFSYATPVLASVSPAYALHGDYAASFVLRGTDLASSNDTLVGAWVGGVACGSRSVEVLSGHDVRVVCDAVPANAWAQSSTVRLDLADGKTYSFTGLVTVYARPTVSKLVPASGPTLGGTSVTITGSGFGREDGDVIDVWFGDRRATSVEVLDAATLSVTTPPGISSGRLVWVVLRTGAQSEPEPLWSYARPSVSSTVPSYAYLFAADSGALTVVGTNFGNGYADLESIEVQSSDGSTVACPAVALVWKSSTEVQCQSFGAALSALQAGFAQVTVTIGDQESVMARGDLFSLISIPVISFVTPTQGPTDGGGTVVTLSGFNLGRVAADLFGVWVGGVPAVSVTWDSETQLRFVLPPGAGGGLSVRVETRGGASQPNSVFRYNNPLVDSIVPDYALTGPEVLANFTIFGSNFGPSALADGSASFVDSATVGGSACAKVVFVSSTEVQCFGVNGTVWDGNEVQVSVAGLVSSSNRAFTPMGNPSVDIVSPDTAAVGAELLVLGSNFGNEASELVDITIDGVSCTQIVHRGPNAATCVVPPPRPEKAEQARDSPTILRGLSLLVHTLGPQQNPNRQALFAYTGSGEIPRNAPYGVVAWRDVGVSGSIRLRWFHTHLPEWAWNPTPERKDDAAIIRQFEPVPESFVVRYAGSVDALTNTTSSQVVLTDSVRIRKVLDTESMVTA
jgi:hypothetical protein